ncbi:hypothetical protein FocTR4_00014730 [Fusarium oxysporum f. sp. cubense]|uniref:Heterokaryon incompatibility domain-containing protein n=1 Tax=Fusarium oxysporum f. sp. cubense TaxID=61366 RepID=A0A5C6SXV0_FUSOC|nr:hypothetical protein FocTR4_00014730 [Fusarium oxysporum f. sp. cubense]
MHLLRWEFMDEDDTFKIHLEQHTTVTDYAILSHRWGKPEDEVSFDDMIAGTHESKKGHENLSAVVDKPEIDGIRHVWVDTCCINKASSAELSDPITSMFAYYNQSRVCYAFLNDVIIASGVFLAKRLVHSRVDSSRAYSTATGKHYEHRSDIVKGPNYDKGHQYLQENVLGRPEGNDAKEGHGVLFYGNI